MTHSSKKRMGPRWQQPWPILSVQEIVGKTSWPEEGLQTAGLRGSEAARLWVSFAMKFPANALLTLASHPHCWLLGQTIQPEEATTQPTYATRWEERHGTSQDRTSAPSCPLPAALAHRGDHPTAEPLPSPPTHAPSRPQGILQMPSPGLGFFLSIDTDSPGDTPSSLIQSM